MSKDEEEKDLTIFGYILKIQEVLYELFPDVYAVVKISGEDEFLIVVPDGIPQTSVDNGLSAEKIMADVANRLEEIGFPVAFGKPYTL